MKLTRVTGLLVVFLLAGCGARTGGPATPDPSPRGRFLSASVTVDGRPHALVTRTRIALDFTGDGRLVANAGCNTMSGTVRTGGGRLATAGLAMTEMGCDAPRHEQDAWLAGILDANPAWRQDGRTLTITAGGTELVLTREEDRPLTGTWTLDTLLDGQTASSTPAGTTATLVFDGERVGVDAGCNDISATYAKDGDTLTFGEATRTRKACRPDIMRLESAVLDVIRGAVTVEVDGDRLTLTNADGGGLQLHAG